MTFDPFFKETNDEFGQIGATYIYLPLGGSIRNPGNGRWQRRIAGAAFDVYQTHPVPHQSPFLKLDNAVFTPHIGGATDGTVERYSRLMCQEIEGFLEGKRPQNLVNPEVWRG